jgi:hypothetical protein
VDVVAPGAVLPRDERFIDRRGLLSHSVTIEEPRCPFRSSCDEVRPLRGISGQLDDRLG